MTGQTLGMAPFDVHKAIAAVALLVRETGASMYSVLKMLYLADKKHLEEHGRFISGDRYVAMEQGPVPSFTYNMIKHTRGDTCRREGDEIARQYLQCCGDSHAITILQHPDYDELSSSDEECLQEVAHHYNTMGKRAIRDLSHDAVWEKIWAPGKQIRLRKVVSMPIEEIVSDLDNADALLAHLRDPHPGAA